MILNKKQKQDFIYANSSFKKIDIKSFTEEELDFYYERYKSEFDEKAEEKRQIKEAVFAFSQKYDIYYKIVEQNLNHFRQYFDSEFEETVLFIEDFYLNNPHVRRTNYDGKVFSSSGELIYSPTDGLEKRKDELMLSFQTMFTDLRDDMGNKISNIQRYYEKDKYELDKWNLVTVDILQELNNKTAVIDYMIAKELKNEQK